MPVYTVTKPVGTKDKEFEAYTRLLENIGIDVSNSPRVPEPGSYRRWLYAWREKPRAELFAAELRRRTGDGSWYVYEFDSPDVDRGPVAPIEIAVVPEQGVYTYYLTPASRERVVASHRGAKLPGNLTVPPQEHHELLRDGDSDRWMQIARGLTGRTDAEIDALGGVRIVVGDDTVAFQRIPSAA
jgi:hypothetical protein